MNRQPDQQTESDREPAAFMLARGLFGCSRAEVAISGAKPAKVRSTSPDRVPWRVGAQPQG